MTAATRLSLWIQPDLRKRISDLAQQERRSVNKQSELLLERALEEEARKVA